MRIAYKRADGRKIDGRRVLVDVERGRTVRDWKVSLPVCLFSVHERRALCEGELGMGGCWARRASPLLDLRVHEEVNI